MQDPEIKKLYKFALDDDAKKKRILIFVTVTVLILIAISFIYQFISGFGTNQNTRITQTVENPSTEENLKMKELQDKSREYLDAGIPYDDPQGRYSISFGTPIPSSSIVVTIVVADSNGSIRKEIDERIRVASTYVEISAITYLDKSGQN